MPGLGLVCCYFNFSRSIRRYKIFCQFYRHICQQEFPLVVVEYAHRQQPFELTQVPEVIQVRGDSVLWQKERLLQIGIDQLLQRGYEKIAWLDADIIFENPDWAREVSKALDQYRVVQCFSFLNHHFDDEIKNNKGTVCRLLEDGEFSVTAGGIAWAAQAPVLKEAQLYQHFIVGGGDVVFLLGCIFPEISQLAPFISSIPISKALVAGMNAWIKKMQPLALGHTGYVNQKVTALAHGTNKNRKYWERYNILNDFIPDKDLHINPHGAFEWATPKPLLHKSVENYILQRDQ